MNHQTALIKAYSDLGVVRPELETQKSLNIGDKNSREKNSSVSVHTQSQEITTMENVQNGTHEIPAVARKTEAPIAAAQPSNTIKLTHSLGARAAERSVDGLVLGTFAVGVGAALMALSKVILKPA